MNEAMSLSEQLDAIEAEKMRHLDVIVTKSSLFTMADGQRQEGVGNALLKRYPGKYFLMGDDPRLPKMPAQPTLVDFFKMRFGPAQHLLQSARHARNAGCTEKIVLACLLHDISVLAFIRGDHGYYGAQLVEPYVDEEVSWAIRTHQALRFFPDEAAGYAYPDQYKRFFGPDYKPEPYIFEEYERARRHRWYDTARTICVNDIYSFDPNVKASLDEFVDVIGRNFRQPKEGLGFDSSPVAHMWRSINRPTRFL
jgi:hypothetical protein